MFSRLPPCVLHDESMLFLVLRGYQTVFCKSSLVVVVYNISGSGVEVLGVEETGGSLTVPWELSQRADMSPSAHLENPNSAAGNY